MKTQLTWEDEKFSAFYAKNSEIAAYQFYHIYENPIK